MSLRIVAVVGLFRPAIGGTEIQTGHLAREWAARGNQVEIWTRLLEPQHPVMEVLHGVVVRRLGRANPSKVLAMQRLDRIAFSLGLWFRLLSRKKEYDVVIAQHALYPAVVAAFACRLTKRPFLLRIASSGVTSDLDAFGRLSNLAIRLLRDEARTVIVLTRQSVAEVTSRGFAPDVVRVVPNGVETHGEPKTRPLGRRPKVVYVGAFRPEKRVDVLLRAWARANCPGELALVGDGALRPTLETLAKNLQIDVAFLGNVQDSRAVLKDADVFVLSSDAEGMSNALLEAMAEGCACLATYVGGNVDCLAPQSTCPPIRGEIIKGRAGWLVSPGDEIALAAGLEALCSDHDLRRTLGKEARQKVVEDNSLTTTAAQYVQIFRGVLNENLANEKADPAT